MIIVSKDSGDFSSLQEAILSIPDTPRETVTVLIEPGIYEEKVFIRKHNICLVGKDRENTVIRYGDGAKKQRGDGTDYGTFNTAAVFFSGSDITVRNLTFENTAGPGRVAGQALAAFIASDRTAFYNCAFHGFQDTIFTGDVKDPVFMRLMLPDFIEKSTVPWLFDVNRNYFENCLISGDVDYLFGPSTAFFNRCRIESRLLSSESTAFITAASTPSNQEYGYVFYRCDITGEGGDGSIYLGRPWRDYAKTAFIECAMDKHIHPEGWDNWGKPKAEAVSSYIEYGNTGPGAAPGKRVSFSKQLTNPGIPEYFSYDKVLGGHDGWLPANAYTVK